MKRRSLTPSFIEKWAVENVRSDLSKRRAIYFSLVFEAPEALLPDLSELLPFSLDCFEPFAVLPWPLVAVPEGFDLLSEA